MNTTFKQVAREDRWLAVKSSLGLNGLGKSLLNIGLSTEIFSLSFKARSNASGFPTSMDPMNHSCSSGASRT